MSRSSAEELGQATHGFAEWCKEGERFGTSFR